MTRLTKTLMVASAEILNQGKLYAEQISEVDHFSKPSHHLDVEIAQ